MDAKPGKPAYAGVDTHKDTNALALVDALGRVVGTWEFPTGAAGYEMLEETIDLCQVFGHEFLKIHAAIDSFPDDAAACRAVRSKKPSMTSAGIL